MLRGGPKRQYHSDLASFVRSSLASKTDQTTHVFRGTLFEYTTQAVLDQAFGPFGLCDLVRVGGAADNGIDLLGRWQVSNGFMNVLVQCKSSQTKVAPRIWRELAGTRLRLDDNSTPWLAILAGPSLMTPKSLAAFNSLDIPLMHCRINQPPILYNEAKNEPECIASKSDMASMCTNRSAKTLFTELGIDIDKLA